MSHPSLFSSSPLPLPSLPSSWSWWTVRLAPLAGHFPETFADCSAADSLRRLAHRVPGVLNWRAAVIGHDLGAVSCRLLAPVVSAGPRELGDLRRSEGGQSTLALMRRRPQLRQDVPQRTPPYHSLAWLSWILWLSWRVAEFPTCRCATRFAEFRLRRLCVCVYARGARGPAFQMRDDYARVHGALSAPPCFI